MKAGQEEMKTDQTNTLKKIEEQLKTEIKAGQEERKIQATTALHKAEANHEQLKTKNMAIGMQKM